VNKNQFVFLKLMQQDIDLKVTTYATFGEKLEEFDSPNYRNGFELFTLASDNEGAYIIDKKLGQNIFTNRISNAVKFSPKADKVVVELSSEKDYTVISVTDFGIGIPESELKKIFAPFTRGESVDLITGIGLGLTIAKGTINAIGGEIIVKSTIEIETSVFVKIPKI
tara:strand:- start:1273 stop:1773 length:501 start_codon:yes stop_codon:yes gene_type:complete